MDALGGGYGVHDRKDGTYVRIAMFMSMFVIVLVFTCGEYLNYVHLIYFP